MNLKLKKTLIYAFNLVGVLILFLLSSCNDDNIADNNNPSIESNSSSTFEKNANGNSIENLTFENTVIAYVKTHRKLPHFYMTKSAARAKGWIPSKGNLCDVLPGKAIGGDKFSNREKLLPSNNQYFEADVNCKCGRRGADRIIFTNNGDVWLTKDHYKSFVKQ